MGQPAQGRQQLLHIGNRLQIVDHNDVGCRLQSIFQGVQALARRRWLARCIAPQLVYQAEKDVIGGEF